MLFSFLAIFSTKTGAETQLRSLILFLNFLNFFIHSLAIENFQWPKNEFLFFIFKKI